MTDLEMLNELYSFVLSQFSDQVLSITPKTQEQVDILKNVSSQYEVEMFFLFCKYSAPNLRVFLLIRFHVLCDQTSLWQPVSPQHIQEEMQVHLYVPASSLETVTDLLNKHIITHEYIV